MDLIPNNEKVFIKEESSDEFLSKPSEKRNRIIKNKLCLSPKNKIGRKRIFPINENKQDQILKRYEARKLQRSVNREQEYSCMLCPGINYVFR